MNVSVGLILTLFCSLVQAAWRGRLSRRHICGTLVVHVRCAAGLPVPLLRKINPYVALEILDDHRKVGLGARGGG